MRRTIVLALLLAGCGGTTATTAPDPTERPAEAAVSTPVAGDVDLDDLCSRRFPEVPPVDDVLVGLVTDSGSVDDGTFNQSAYSGMRAARRCFGFETTYVATGRSDLGVHLDALIDQGADVVVTVGHRLAEATRAAALAHPDVAFVGVDQTATPVLVNYAGVSFRDDQAGFLAGAAAALLTRSGTVGAVGGTRTVPAVAEMLAGYRAGVHHVDPDVTVRVATVDSFSAPARGASRARALTDVGADVVFGPAGLTGAGAIVEAAATGAWVVGVDQDQYYTTFRGGLEPGSRRLATSAIKRIDLGVFLHLADVAEGGLVGGPHVLGAAEGGVTYAPPHEASVPVAATARLESIRVGLADGSIDPGA